MELETPRSRMSLSGLFGGWLLDFMSHPSLLHTSLASGPSVIQCPGVFRRSSYSVPVVSHCRSLFRERVNADLSGELAMAPNIVVRPSNRHEEHHFRNVKLCCTLHVGSPPPLVQVVPLPVLDNVEPLFVRMNEVFKVVELLCANWSGSEPAQRPC